MKGRLAFAALWLLGCGSRTSLSTRDAAPFVDDDPYLKLDAGSEVSAARANDGGAGAPVGGGIPPGAPPPDAAAVSSTAGAERALRDIAKLLWQAEPDPAHLALARSGQIRSSTDLERIVQQMLANPHSATGVGNFFRWWLSLEDLRGIKKDPQLFPIFPKVVDPLIEDVVGFGTAITLSDGHFATLMTATRPFGDMSLAALVGESGDSPRRPGLLGRPGLLALHALPARPSPTKRGLFVRQSLLCDDIPSAPANIDTSVPPQPPQLTNREHYASLMSAPSCATCHHLIDDIGYGFESFDAVGAFRLIDHGRMVDASGILQTASGERRFNGLPELAKLLVSDPGAQKCIVAKWYQFLRGTPASPGDALLARAQDVFARGNLDMRDVIVTVLGATPLN